MYLSTNQPTKQTKERKMQMLHNGVMDAVQYSVEASPTGFPSTPIASVGL